MNSKLIPGREPFNGWSHFLAALAALVGSYFLAKDSWNQGVMFFAKIFYGITLVSAFGSSALYHLARTNPKNLRILRNIDHACILALMIGTYVPVTIAMFPNNWKILLLISFLILLGAGIRLAKETDRKVLSVSYIVLASLPALAVPFVWDNHWQAVLWFSLGSCFYSIGAYCYMKKLPKKNAVLKFHEIWHICVIFGSLVHFLLIYHLP